jgi:biopolymer transport protein ExbD
MAINVNGGGGAGRRRFHGTPALSEINVTPFVDVVLVLLIIFMVTAQVMNSDIQVDVPKTKLVRESVRDLPIVKITRDGEVFLNDQRININELGSIVKSRFHGQSVYLLADKDAVW